MRPKILLSEWNLELSHWSIQLKTKIRYTPNESHFVESELNLYFPGFTRCNGQTSTSVDKKKTSALNSKYR